MLEERSEKREQEGEVCANVEARKGERMWLSKGELRREKERMESAER